jgi:hypothetical protein
VSRLAWKLEQTLGRLLCPNIEQRLLVKFTQGSPAFFPLGIPGIAEEMEISMQQAEH